jgi:hypothetical protein
MRAWFTGRKIICASCSIAWPGAVGCMPVRVRSNSRVLSLRSQAERRLAHAEMCGGARDAAGWRASMARAAHYVPNRCLLRASQTGLRDRLRRLSRSETTRTVSPSTIGRELVWAQSNMNRSQAKFPANRENNREFRLSAAGRAPKHPRAPVFFSFGAPQYHRSEQGMSAPITGKTTPRTGSGRRRPFLAHLAAAS